MSNITENNFHNKNLNDYDMQNSLCVFSQKSNNHLIINSEINENLIEEILKDSKKKYLSNNFLMVAMLEFICTVMNNKRINSDRYNFNGKSKFFFKSFKGLYSKINSKILSCKKVVNI